MAIAWHLASGWGTVKLGEVAPEVSSQIRTSDYPTITFNYWGLDAIDKGQFAEPSPNPVSGSQIASTCVKFGVQHVLYGKLRPYLNKVIVPSVEGIGTTEWIVLQPRLDAIDRFYLAYTLRTQTFVDHISSSSTGARMPRARKDVLWDTDIPIPYPDDPVRSVETQRRIVARIEALLAEVREARKIHQQLVEDTGQLLNSCIQNTFDRPNSDWREYPLSEIAYVQTGTAKGRRFGNRETVELPYLRVANVQAGYLDLNETKTIRIARHEIDRYRLQPGDLLLTEGGDYDKLGRGAVWQGAIDLCIHQNHIFAVRFDQSQVLPRFAEYEMQSRHAKNYFVGAAKKTTNLATINKTQLGAFPVRFPAPAKQESIVASLDAVQAEVSAMRRAQADAEDLLVQMEQVVLAQAFRGEL